jgi:hypothetical protein
VAEAYLSNWRCSPCHNASSKFSKFLSVQLKGHRNNDPSTRPQKAFMPSILRELSKNDNGPLNPLNRATHQLAQGAFFFAMGSCEYPTVTGEVVSNDFAETTLPWESQDPAQQAP